MSSKDEIRKRRDRSRSPPMDRRRDHRARSVDRRRHSRSPDTSKHRHSSKDTKHKSSSRERNHSKERSKSKKHKKKKKKKHSSSSSDSSDSDEELKLLLRLEAERERLKEEKRKEKEALKAKETPEEKRARRLKEKQEKERKRRERMGWDGEYQCYTDQDNPFGDSALTHTFVWTKKLANEGVKTVSREELEARNRQKQLENKIELEKVKQRRLERETERAAREAETAEAARAREAAQFHTWARQEDAFHLQQARLRSQIRIRDGRAKPIDLLAWYVESERRAEALELPEPYACLHGLSAVDLDDLLEDIKVYKELENNANQSYWEDVRTIVVDELNKLRQSGARRDGVHRAVAADVTQIFKGKSGAQLAALQTQVEEKIRGRRDGVDVAYWESLLSQLKAHMSRARLRDRHQDNLRHKLRLLKEEQGLPSLDTSNVDTVHTQHEQQSRRSPVSEETETAAEMTEATTEEETESAMVSAYLAGRYSPEPVPSRAVSPGVAPVSAAEDEARLALFRARLRHASGGATTDTAPSSSVGTSVEALEQEARRSMGAAGAGAGASGAGVGASGAGAGDAQFSVEYALERPALWPDKYRPRKPRYFNRVHTGFEWNKYNQTHYDMDNPPPKIVQGYKFNIFYPDLIDKSSTPEFSLKPCPENGEFAVLRFHAGPPYEDIAFKIVNREWEYSYKRGFRCHFHNNIFQLWFHFKRYRYRR